MIKFFIIFIFFFLHTAFAENKIIELEGNVLINEHPATYEHVLNAGDRIDSNYNGYIKFTFNDSAYELKKILLLYCLFFLINRLEI